MSFFSKKNVATRYRLIVDLEPNSVGLGLTLAGSSKFEFYDRLYIAYGRKPSSKQVNSKLSALLKNGVIKLIAPRIGKGVISSILCIHSSAWSVAETHTVDLHFPKPVKINEKLVIDSVRNHRSDHVTEAQAAQLELVYHHVQKVRLNGYPTISPWDKMTQSVSCDIVEGYIDASIKKMCEEALLRFNQSMTHIPAAFIATFAARQVVPDMSDALIVHIGGETTEIIFANAHHIHRSVSIPSGISTLIRGISEYVHDDTALAFSHVTMAMRGSRVPTKKEQTALSTAVAGWKKHFMEGIHTVCGTHVPEKIMFFSAQHDMEIAEHLFDLKELGAWSGQKHDVVNLFGKKSFQHDFMIAAGAQYGIE